MRNICTLGLMGFFLLLGGCASHHTANDGQIDLYLSTLDDKHFVWCELDLEQCRHDFGQWKLTTRGRRIIQEFEQMDTGHTDNTQLLPHVFRTRFVEKGQLGEELLGEQAKGQNSGQDNKGLVRSDSTIDKNDHSTQEEMRMIPKNQGPQFLPPKP
ncbi:MAG: hypothetical protein NPIRA06_01800 [Nitrospirales bacterium]|nr:MAG: hypothetical protein NPIRA06_01800 [Nitrospirales bacterium]